MPLTTPDYDRIRKEILYPDENTGIFVGYDEFI